MKAPEENNQFNSNNLIESSPKNQLEPLKEQKTNTKPPTKRWTEEEIEALVDGITTYGIGSWKIILNYNKHIFSKNERSMSDIARKWNDLKKNPKYHFLLKYKV